MLRCRLVQIAKVFGCHVWNGRAGKGTEWNRTDEDGTAQKEIERNGTEMSGKEPIGQEWDNAERNATHLQFLGRFGLCECASLLTSV